MHSFRLPLFRSAAGFAASALIAAGSLFSPAAAQEKGPITMVSGDLTDNFFSTIKKGADDAAKDFGVQYTYVGVNLSGPDLAKALKAAIAANSAGIAFGDWFPEAEEGIVLEATRGGTPAVIFNAGSPDWKEKTGAFALIGQSNYNAGVLGGSTLLKAGAKHVLCVNHSPGSSNLEARCAGLADALKKAGGAATTLNVPYQDATNPTKFTQAVQGALANDKTVDAVFTLGSSMAVNAARAIGDAGVGGKVKIGSVDMSSGLLDLVKEGKVAFTIDQQPYLQGYYAIAILAQQTKYGLHLVDEVSTGPALVDRSNVEQVIKINAEHQGIRGAF